MAFSDAPDVDRVMRGRSPSILDLVDSKMLVSGAVATVMFALVELNAARHVSPLDALDLALRMVALGACVRAVLGLIAATNRFRSALRSSRRVLVLTDESLVVLESRTSDHAHVIPRGEVVGAYGGRRADRSAELLAFVNSQGEPSVFEIALETELDPAIHASRIRRWSGHADPQDVDAYPDPSRTPSEDFERIARGQLRRGEVAVAIGRGWLARGPYAAGAFVFVLLERLGHVPDKIALGKPVMVLSALCVVLPLGWLVIGLRRARASGGVAMVLTPAELLLRDARGIHRAPWGDVTSLQIRARRSWTLMGGVSLERTLVVERASSTDLPFDERRMAHSAPAVAALLEAYGEGVFASSTPASQASAAGGGISAISGTST